MIPLQDEWDRREMTAVRCDRLRRAKENAMKETSMWGRAVTPPNVPGGEARWTGDHGSRAASSGASGEGSGQVAEAKDGADGTHPSENDVEMEYIPAEPLLDESWQACVFGASLHVMKFFMSFPEELILRTSLAPSRLCEVVSARCGIVYCRASVVSYLH